jgi:hypothetical protein
MALGPDYLFLTTSQRVTVRELESTVDAHLEKVNPVRFVHGYKIPLVADTPVLKVLRNLYIRAGWDKVEIYQTGNDMGLSFYKVIVA